MAMCLLMSWSPCPIRSAAARRSLQDGPRFEKRLDPERTEFTSDAGVLEPAERRLLIVKQAVDDHAAGKDLRSHASRAPYVGPARVPVRSLARVALDPRRFFLGLS